VLVEKSQGSDSLVMKMPACVSWGERSTANITIVVLRGLLLLQRVKREVDESVLVRYDEM